MSLPSKTILFLSTLGENRTEVYSERVNFLRFVKADLNESQEDFDDDLNYDYSEDRGYYDDDYFD